MQKEQLSQMCIEIRRVLLEMAEPAYQKFSASLLPKVTNILGVRLPKLRNYARQVWKIYGIAYLEEVLQEEDNFAFQTEYMEEILLQGMVLGNLRDKLLVKEGLTLCQIQGYIRKYVSKIDNWSTCDSFCAGLKIAKEYPVEMWDFLQEYFFSKRAYDVRFGLVMIIDYYIEESYLETLFNVFCQIGENWHQTNGKCKEADKQNLYYVQMALAWAVSICYIRFPVRTMAYLEQMQTETAVFDDFVYHKALQKITESHCVSKEDKQVIKKMKRN